MRYALLLACISLTLAAAEESLTIVSSLPRTGSVNGQTTTIVNGIRLAIDQAGGTVAGFRIEYQDWDDASAERGSWDPAVEAANADKAIADTNVVAYIGTFNSGAAKVSMPKLNQASLAMVSPANTYTGLTKPGKGAPSEPAVYRPSGQVTYFRVVPADDIQGLVGAQWAVQMGAKRVYILHDRELYGQGLATVFEASAKALGLEVVGSEGINPKEPTYRTLVTKMKMKKPDLIYFGGTTQTNGGQLAKDLVAGGLDVKLMVPDGCCEKAFIEAAGEAAVHNRVFFTFPGVPPQALTGRGKEFVDAYVAKYGSKPEPFAVYGYECAKVIIDAIRRTGSKDRAAICAALRETRDFAGALGTWSFDENGDTSLTTASGNIWQDGDFAFLQLLGGSK